MFLARVKAWHKRFRERWVSLANDAQSGTPHHITDDIIQLVDGLFTQESRFTVKAIAAEVGCVHTIMTERKDCVGVKCAPNGCPTVFNHNRKHVKWPTVLIICSAMPEMEMSSWHEWWLEISLCVITSNQKQNDKVSGGSIQDHHHQIKSKAINTSAGKVMLTFFFDQDFL